MLDWPLQGELVYRFGRVTGANSTQTLRNGIGISAPRGASVRAVADAVVASTGSVPGYGRIIILAHAAGDYSLYSSLERIMADSGAAVMKGQVIGTVGTSDADLGPHLHFEVRLGTNISQPVDPIPFLKPRG
jgi:murein DD-endopeptidase MepM/ murein hydrolase activator NlpD